MQGPKDQGNSGQFNDAQKKIMALQQAILKKKISNLQSKGGGAGLGGAHSNIKKGFFSYIVSGMNKLVKYIDLVIKFVVKGNFEAGADVVKYAKPPILFGTYIIVFFVLTGLIWATTAPLDSASIATGTVTSISKKQIINHPYGGIIKNMLVQVGDQVSTGAQLIELEDLKTRSEYENALSHYIVLLAAYSRLIAEINHYDTIEFPSFLLALEDKEQVDRITSTQNSLFESRISQKQALIDSNAELISQNRKNIEVLKAKQIYLNRNLELIREKLKSTEILVKRGFAQKIDLSELQAKEIAARVEIDINKTEILREEQGISKIIFDFHTTQDEWNNKLFNEFKDTQTSLFTAQHNYNHTSDALEKSIIISPIEGKINQINFYTKGQYIPPSTPILEITPINEDFIIEAQVNNKDIDSISVGSVAKIKFPAFKSRTSPLFKGKVISISPDVVNDGRPPAPTGKDKSDMASAQAYYIAKIELDPGDLKKISEERNLNLYPGMMAEIQIVRGTRTLFRYLLDPVFDAAFRSFKEK